jgi:hypothetical protein
MIGAAVLRTIRFEELLGCGVKIEQGLFTFDRLGILNPASLSIDVRSINRQRLSAFGLSDVMTRVP